MNTNKSKFYFFLFVLPALSLYALFFIYPFFQGIGYSFVRWNGITPEVPARLTSDKFDNLIDFIGIKDKIKIGLRKDTVVKKIGLPNTKIVSLKKNTETLIYSQKDFEIDYRIILTNETVNDIQEIVNR